MHLLDDGAASDRVRDPVHLETQRATGGLDLTVEEIARVTGPGQLDFGGSEFEPADCATLEPELAAPEDDYGWWRLEPGSYLALYNESLEPGEDEIALIQPLPRLLRAGASHAGFVASEDRDPLVALLEIGPGGCHLKENCRISRLLVLETS